VGRVQKGNTDTKTLVTLLPDFLSYSLGPPFPCLELTDAGNDKLINDLVTFLELRMNKKNLLLKDWQQKREYHYYYDYYHHHHHHHYY
jgi:hypothetical protein